MLGLYDALHSPCCLVFTSSFIGQVRGIETVTTYDSKTGEFVIHSPCESAQKYWIGGAANVKSFSSLFLCCFSICLFAHSYL